MDKSYILDACAIIAFLSDEQGSDKIESFLQKANNNKIKIFMHKINILEVYYGVYRTSGKLKASKVLKLIYELPIQIISDIDNKLILESGRIKAIYSLSLADAIVAGTAILNNYILITADHHEFEVIREHEKIKIHWFR